MDKFKNKYRIPSNRLQNWDYSQHAAYFITICTQKREHFLGKIVNSEMILSKYGKIVELEIMQMSTYYKGVIVDDWVIMPNHIHFIVVLSGTVVETIHELSDNDTVHESFDNDTVHESFDNDTVHESFDNDTVHESFDVETIHELSLQQRQQQQRQNKRRILRRQMLIPKIIGKFKMKTSKQMNIHRNSMGRKNWQSNYYDHIIRNNKSYENIRNYIYNNPKNWQNDKLYK